MRLLLTADWHLSPNPRDAYRFGAIERIRALIQQHKVEHLFILGDLTEHADHHSAAFTNRVVDMLNWLAEDCDVTIIRGNHDGHDPSVPFFRFINAIPDVHFVTEYEMLVIAGGHAIAMIPHGCWPDRLDDTNLDMVLTHNTFAGAKAEHGKHLGGLRLPLSNVPIYSGDIHVPQSHGRLTYVGAPTLIDFGDSYRPRVLLMHRDPQHGWSPGSIPIKGPNKRQYDLIVTADGFIKWPETPVMKGDIVRLRVHFPEGIPSLAHLRASLHNWATDMGVSLYSIVPVLEQRGTAMPTAPVSRNDADLVRQYGATRSLDAPTVDAGLSIVDRKGV